MTLQNPRTFEKTIDETAAKILRRLEDLKRLYCGDSDDGGAYHMGLERTVRGSAGKISHGTSDPTLEVVGDPLDKEGRPGLQAALRKVLDSAPKKLTEAENVLSTLETNIRKAMDRLDPPETFEPTRYPIDTTEAERQQYREAQARRRAREAESRKEA